MTYNEYLKEVRKRYLEHVEKYGPEYSYLCKASLSAATESAVAHYLRLQEAIEKELRNACFLTTVWKTQGRYGILQPKGRKDTHRKRGQRVVSARLQWLDLQAK